MKWITGTGLAVGAVAAGAPLALLGQGAASADTLGTGSSATAAEHHLQLAGTALEGTPTGQANPDRTLGQAHATAMKAWARCVNAAARGSRAAGEQVPATQACGLKPLGPGQLRHEAPTTTVPVPAGATAAAAPTRQASLGDHRGDHTQGDHTQGDHTQGDHTQGDHTQGPFVQGHNAQRDLARGDRWAHQGFGDHGHGGGQGD